MVLILICLLVFGTAGELTDLHLRLEYASYKARYSKIYTAEEDQIHFTTFKSSLSTINEINNSNLGFSLNLGPLSDQLPEEVGTIPNFDLKLDLHPEINYLNTDNLPESVDWVKSGKVSPLRTQGTCKATWIFSTIDTIESIVAITKGTTTTTLSSQQFISCSDSSGNSGCTSGTIEKSFNFALSNNICTESQYPFIDNVASCKKKLKCQTQISSVNAIIPNNEAQLKAAVAIQPVSVTLNITTTLMNYKSGVLPSGWCGTSTVQSNFVIVGYGSIANVDYWVIRSYWGNSWGIGGYGLVARNDKNTANSGSCGIASAPLAPSFNF
ncbi:hypothetical protein SteCoe_11630 [Stentor coeruleus]|uniref:Peptidase C1A papain C-terminal domain-containing protein n=1 Tax=Stentor coeruleus TaxID=5963 RepID=A0A1R2CCR1_9CILI|nr:hypothetical protein SteCoe_11630 [Stentor coeruleus]